MCDDFKSIAIGMVVGLALGAGWFALIKSTHQNGCFMVMKKKSKKCKLGPTKFKCNYMNNYNKFFYKNSKMFTVESFVLFFIQSSKCRLPI